MAGAPGSDSQRLKRAKPKSFDYGFGKFQVDLSSHLSYDSVKKLATIFCFPPAKFDRVKFDSLEFVRALEEEGIITPTDISAIIDALKSIGQKGIATTVQESFEWNQVKRPQKEEPGVLCSQLQRNHSVFVEALKKEYRKRCRGVKPIPFLHDTWHCVNDIFVETKLEELDNTKQQIDPSRWTAIKSRHEVLTQPSCGNVIVIEGEPGFGKSTLLLQYAYDWSTSSTDLPLRDIDIFVLIRLKEMKDALTIFEAIRMLLPDDFPLTSKDIEAVVTSGHWKVVIALDGYDEYTGMEGKATDVTRIIQGRILSACIIVISTRPSCLPKLQSPNARHFKLTGFDQQMQEEYIDKSITSNALTRGAKELIMGKLRENVILSDICQVPFFLATFAHMHCMGTGMQELNSVTSYFSFMLACFFSHLDSKEPADNRPLARPTSKEDPEQRLLIAKLAFHGFVGKEQTLLWTQADLVTQLSLSCYKRYVSAGVLLEEEHRTFQAIPGSHADNQIVVKTNTRFFHKTIQEFYAAYHIAHLAETQTPEMVKKSLSYLDLYDLQYVLRFACGLKPNAAKVVQEYLGILGEDGRMFSVLCLMEQQEGNINETVANLCRNDVMITGGESKFFQRSKIQLLHTASQRNIFISKVRLSDCFKSVDLNEESLCLFSGLKLPRLDTLQFLEISGLSADLRDRARDILDFSARCVALKVLAFIVLPFFGNNLLLPRLFEDKDVLTRLYEKNCTVLWLDLSRKFMNMSVPVVWKLNLLSGLWENEDGREMTDEEYRRIVSQLLKSITISDSR